MAKHIHNIRRRVPNSFFFLLYFFIDIFNLSFHLFFFKAPSSQARIRDFMKRFDGRSVDPSISRFLLSAFASFSITGRFGQSVGWVVD